MNSVPVLNTLAKGICWKTLKLCKPRKWSFSMIFRLASNNVVDDLQTRKVVQAIFPDERVHLPELLKNGVQCAYAGFDPTADSLHLGNLAVIMGLLHWTKMGHDAIALIGGATAMIGDPSGRSSEREAAIEENVQTNCTQIQALLERIFKNYQENFDSDKQYPNIKILNNMTWYKNENIVSFLSTVGKYFKIGEMIARTSVQSRLNSRGGISFCEFSYQIFQAYDWIQLLEKYKCHFQLGGMDQMGNIHGGRDVISRVKKQHVYGLMLPLLLTEMGSKFGKSAGNAVWLEPHKTSPYELYQYFIRLPDKEVEAYLGIFLFDSMTEIQSLLERHKQVPEKRLPQLRLAETVTLLIHGEMGLKSANNCTKALFNSTPDTLSQLSKQEITDVFQQAPSLTLQFRDGITVLDLAMEANCFNNTFDAERIISRGGFYVNFSKITDPKTNLDSSQHVLHNGISLLRVGKRNYYLINWM